MKILLSVTVHRFPACGGIKKFKGWLVSSPGIPSFDCERNELNQGFDFRYHEFYRKPIMEEKACGLPMDF
jgi:hypothetical protein